MDEVLPPSGTIQTLHSGTQFLCCLYLPSPSAMFPLQVVPCLSVVPLFPMGLRYPSARNTRLPFFSKRTVHPSRTQQKVCFSCVKTLWQLVSLSLWSFSRVDTHP